jgi:hypothetical protein
VTSTTTTSTGTDPNQPLTLTLDRVSPFFTPLSASHLLTLFLLPLYLSRSLHRRPRRCQVGTSYPQPYHNTPLAVLSCPSFTPPPCPHLILTTTTSTGTEPNPNPNPSSFLHPSQPLISSPSSSYPSICPTPPLPHRYAQRLDEILRRKQQLITLLRGKLTVFRQRLVEEESAATTVNQRR